MGQVSMIAAIGRNRELGRDNDLLWKIPDDLKRFKELTRGHPIVMGRKTFESLPLRPLPQRANIVVTRDAAWQFSGVTRAGSVEEALGAAGERPGGEEIFIIGGGQIYEQALPFAHRLCLTLIDAEAPDADTFFPAYERLFTNQTPEEEREQDGLKYRWIDFARNLP